VTRRRVSNPLALAVLGTLRARPMHPYEISQTLRAQGKEQSIRLNYGSLYTVVEKLTKHGLIEERETVREGRRPERTIYAITDAGVAEYEDWLAELLSTPTREFTSLEAGLSLMAGLPPAEVVRLLEHRVTRLDIELRRLEATHAVTAEMKLPEVFVVESRFRAAMVAAERDFVRQLAADIREGHLGGVEVWRRIHELQATGVDLEDIFADPVTHLGEEAATLVSGGYPGDHTTD
jgi:DNA-binding PadR family transcriptional regulator